MKNAPESKHCSKRTHEMGQKKKRGEKAHWNALKKHEKHTGIHQKPACRRTFLWCELALIEPRHADNPSCN